MLSKFENFKQVQKFLKTNPLLFELKNVLNEFLIKNGHKKQPSQESRDNKNINQSKEKIQSFIMKTWFRFAFALRSIYRKCFLEMVMFSSFDELLL